MEVTNFWGWTEGAHTPLYLMAGRLVLAAILGAVIGFEREFRDRAAGLRTHILIAVAAALFTTLTFEMFYDIREDQIGNNFGDPLRVFEAVTAGVAFLGAGAIFRSGRKIKGITTGAGMWLAGAVGMACATGFYVLAGLATLLAVIVLNVLHRFEDRFFEQD